MFFKISLQGDSSIKVNLITNFALCKYSKKKETKKQIYLKLNFCGLFHTDEITTITQGKKTNQTLSEMTVALLLAIHLNPTHN